MQRSCQGFVDVAHHFCLEKVTSFASKFPAPFLRGGFGGHHCWDTLPSSCPMRCENWWEVGCCLDGGMAQQFWGGKAAVRLVFLVNNCHYLPYFLCIQKGWCKKKRRFSEASNHHFEQKCVTIIRFEPGNGVFLMANGDVMVWWCVEMNCQAQFIPSMLGENQYSDWIRWWFCPKKPLKHEAFRIAA